MELRIHRLTLDNFRCHRHLELTLNGASANIYGDNGTGKTTLYDAFLWLLYGRDSCGRSPQVRPLDGTGSPRDRESLTAVEAELSVDGTIRTLRRTYREHWTLRSGSELYTGSTCGYFLDGVPCRKFYYDEAVRSLVPEGLLPLLTSVQGFFRLGWQQRRGVLLSLLPTGQTLRDPRFSHLRAAMGDREPEEYRWQLQRQVRGLLDDRETRSARMDECQRLLNLFQNLENENLPCALENPPVPAGSPSGLPEDLRSQESLISRVYRSLAQAELRKALEERLSALAAESEKTALTLTGLQIQLRQLDGYDRQLSEKLEEAVNAHFRLGVFRLTRPLCGGGVEPCCGVTCQGIPYESLNSAMRIHLGMDVIQTLSHHYGVHMPLFLDNSEGITSLPAHSGQLIRLLVSKEDRFLRTELV